MNTTELLKRLETLKSERATLETNWRDSYHYSAPQRQQFKTKRKEDEYKDLYDTTLIESTQLLASSLQSGTVPANSQWFKMSAGVDNTSIDSSDKWLEIVSTTMFKNIHNTNFDSEVYDYLTDLIVAGWGCLYIDMLEDKLNFRCWPIVNVYLDSHNEQQTIDCVYREYTLTASQIKNTYPNVSDSIEKSPDHKIFKLVHAIYPNKEYKPSKVSIKTNMPFKSIIIEQASRHILNESGYNTFPVVVSRFNKNYDNLYATGQVNQVLEDARIVNKMNKLLLNSAELNLGGIWIAKNDGVVNVNNLQLRPRTIIPANSVDDIKRLDMNTNLNLSVELVSMYQMRIKRGMMSDQLTPINSSPLSATEVSARVNIIRNQLGSIFIRMQSEFLNNLLNRTFDLLLRANIIPAPPVELIQNRGEINFTFTNPLSQSNKLESVTNTNNWLSIILPLSQVKPDILDNINFDNIVYTLQDALSVSTDFLLSKEELDALREQKAIQQEQQTAVAEQAQMNALTAQDLALQKGAQELKVQGNTYE